MSELSCTCPHCSQELNIGSEYAGQAVGCPSCSGEFTVPAAPASQAPALAAPPQLNVPAAPSLQRPPVQPQTQAPPPQYQQPPQHNPYAQQPNPAGQQYGHPGVGAPSPRALQLFAQTKPWVTLFAVLSSIGPTLLLILGIFVAFVGASIGQTATGMGAGLIYMVIGAIYFLPAWRLWQYTSAIGKLRFTPTNQALDHAIDRQRCFWKTVGIITLCVIGIAIVSMIVTITTAGAIANDPEFFLEQ